MEERKDSDTQLKDSIEQLQITLENKIDEEE